MINTFSINILLLATWQVKVAFVGVGVDIVVFVKDFAVVNFIISVCLCVLMIVGDFVLGIAVFAIYIFSVMLCYCCSKLILLGYIVTCL